MSQRERERPSSLAIGGIRVVKHSKVDIQLLDLLISLGGFNMTINRWSTISQSREMTWLAKLICTSTAPTWRLGYKIYFDENWNVDRFPLILNPLPLALSYSHPPMNEPLLRSKNEQIKRSTWVSGVCSIPWGGHPHHWISFRFRYWGWRLLISLKFQRNPAGSPNKTAKLFGKCFCWV